MRFLAIVVAGLCTVVPAITSAETGEELRARGEQLAKDGRYTEAIDAFKAAERVEPRARHSCLIALAYMRRENWPQAEIWLESCETKATAADPLPEWVPLAKQQLAERLATANVAAIDIKVDPSTPDIKLSVSSWPPDEQFSPRTIHLTPGKHVITATSKGYNDAQKTIDIGDDKAAQTVTITMLPVGSNTGNGSGSGSGSGAIVGAAPAKSKVPLILMASGGTVVAVGAVLHATYYKNAREELQRALNNGDETDAEPGPKTNRWSKARAVTIGVYSIGAATLITGLVLNFTVFKGKEAPAQVSVTPTDGGGMVSVGWSR